MGDVWKETEYMIRGVSVSHHPKQFNFSQTYISAIYLIGWISTKILKLKYRKLLGMTFFGRLVSDSALWPDKGGMVTPVTACLL